MVDVGDRSAAPAHRGGQSWFIAMIVVGVVLVAAAAVLLVIAAHGSSFTTGPITIGSSQSSQVVESSPATATGAPAAEDFAFPAPPASATRLAAWASKPAKTLPGTAYFFGGTSSGVYHLTALGGGTVRTSSLGSLDPQNSCLIQSYTVSPDGRHIAWVRGQVFDSNQQSLAASSSWWTS